MEYKTLANGFKLPVLGLGTWTMGGNMQTDRTNDEKDILAIKEAIKLGLTHIDTAEVYGDGHSEELIAEAIKEFDRSKLFIVSKVFKTNLKYNDLIASAKKSLQRLQTDYIDLYLIHAPSKEIPLEETMKAMDFLVEEGLVKHIGVSNFTVELMREAQKYTKNKIVCNQVEYNLLKRTGGEWTDNMESEIIPYCQENDIFVVAYQPLARGPLTKPGFASLDKTAEKYGKTQAQVAINWLTSKKNIVVIVKSSDPEHLKENIGAVGWKLRDEDIALLNEGFNA